MKLLICTIIGIVIGVIGLTIWLINHYDPYNGPKSKG